MQLLAFPADGTPQPITAVNYLIGNDPARWRTNIPTFGRVRYSGVYRGIDLVYYGNQRLLEYDFVIAPGSEAGAIALEFTGAERMEVEAATGDLLLGIGEKTIRQHKPVVYQETSAGRRNVEGRYALLGGSRVGFEVGAYDRSATLIIDPVLVYSTFLGGDTAARGIALDSSGNAYVAAATFVSIDLATANAFQTTPKGQLEAFVTKLNAAGSGVVYSTYLGGSNDDQAIGIAVDSAGNAYVVGSTGSSDFPTANAFQSTFGGGGSSGGGIGDAFICKLNPDGSALIYSTYLGGSELDLGNGIAVDSSGNAYVTGSTGSTNFPTANAFQSTFGGGITGGTGDAFVAKLNPAGSALVYSTYLGGSGLDNSRAIEVDSAGNVYIAGRAGNSSFPTTAGAFQTTFGGFGDTFIAKLNPAGSALVYSTFLGGSDRDDTALDCLAIDSAGNAYVTGQTESTDFPTANAFQSTLAGVRDNFVAKINATGSALVFSTYLGGSDFEDGAVVAVDSADNVYVAGSTGSADFPLANAFQNTFGGNFSDAFVAKFTPAGALIYSSYLGGIGVDSGWGIAVDAAGDAYVSGITYSPCFPTTVGAFDTSSSNDLDGFVAKISETAPAAALAPCPSQLLNISTRMHVGTDPNQLIGGFIITGSEPKTVIILATGPSLAAFGLQGVLADPVLELFQGNTLIASNDNWKIPAQAEIEDTQLQPSDDLESALVRTLDPGTYTAIVRGTNGTGIGTVQVYDLSQLSFSKLANISSRGSVQPGDENAMIAGFIIGNGGEARVVVRALGPSLAAFGIAGIPDPTLELKNAQGSTLLDNDDWQQAAAAAEISSRGLAPGDALESALAISLPNGGYTAIVRGKGTASGVAVVEVYNVE